MTSTQNCIDARIIAMRVTVLVVCFFVLSNTFAQGLYNTARLYVNGANLYVDGEISNKGRIDNNGVMALTGDWESIGNYSGGGALEAYGTSAQQVAHHGQEVHRFIANGVGTKYIQGAITIADELMLNVGIVQLAAEGALVLKPHATVSGGSPESYVDGALTASGTGYKFFPVGKNGTYAPIEFTDVKGEEAQYSVEVFENAPTLSVDDVIVKRSLYWQRKDLYGKFGGSPVAIDFQRAAFRNADEIVLLTGTSWTEPFEMIQEVALSPETSKISTVTTVINPLILLGEKSLEWTEADLYLPTALSPHALHAENRSARLFGDRLTGEQFRFQVFNRWGDLVFETRSLEAMTNNGWDGREATGKQLMSGVYPYRLTGIDKTGRKLERRGVITIVY